MFDRQRFELYETYFEKEHEDSFVLLDGTGRVMVSAPHSVEQTRRGRIKISEPQTGTLARMLHDELGCPVIFKTKNCMDDANFDEVSPYKQALAEYVKQKEIGFLLDLHQLSPKRDVQINLGTGKGKNVSRAEYIDAAVRAFGKRNIHAIGIDTPFDASCPNTVSSYVSRMCAIPCMQIEIHSLLVWPIDKGAPAKDVYDALAELVTALEKLI